MRIVVNHLTRMRAGYVCVAGVDPETLRHVRPVLDEGALPFDLLARYGGPFDMARIVEMRTARPVGSQPHVEDHVMVPGSAQSGAVMSPDEFWQLLEQLAKPRLRDLFGDVLRRLGRSSCGTDVGQGRVSLGCIHPKHAPRLSCVTQTVSGRVRIRMHLADAELEVDVGVTDIRLHEDDHVTPDRALVERIAQRIERSDDVILGVGLTRPFTVSTADGEPAAHWLQVTNIHLKDEPVWSLD